jgi:hypothetical protein
MGANGGFKAVHGPRVNVSGSEGAKSTASGGPGGFQYPTETAGHTPTTSNKQPTKRLGLQLVCLCRNRTYSSSECATTWATESPGRCAAQAH